MGQDLSLIEYGRQRREGERVALFLPGPPLAVGTEMGMQVSTVSFHFLFSHALQMSSF